MDLRAYLRVLGRHRILVGVGLLVGMALAFLSFVKVDPGGDEAITFRQEETWSANSRIFVTQEGAPYFRVSIPQDPVPAPGEDKVYVPRFTSPERLADLAIIYSRFVDSDQIKSILLAQGNFDEEEDEIVASAAIVSDQNTEALPIIDVSATGTTPAEAIALTKRATEALRQYVRDQQVASGVPEQQRVILEVIETPVEAELIKGRSLTGPVVLLLATLIVVVALAFLLENLRLGKRRAELAHGGPEGTGGRRGLDDGGADDLDAEPAESPRDRRTSGRRRR